MSITNVSRFIAFVESVRVEQGIANELARVAAEVEAQEQRARVPAAVPWSGSSSVPDALGSRAPNAGGGGIDFEGLNTCEAGAGQNGWRTGRYGIEAGYPIGHLSDAEQQAWVRRIYNDFGAGAWGVNCQRFLGG